MNHIHENEFTKYNSFISIRLVKIVQARKRFHKLQLTHEEVLSKVSLAEDVVSKKTCNTYRLERRKKYGT